MRSQYRALHYSASRGKNESKKTRLYMSDAWVYTIAGARRALMKPAAVFPAWCVFIVQHTVVRLRRALLSQHNTQCCVFVKAVNGNNGGVANGKDNDKALCVYHVWRASSQCWRLHVSEVFLGYIVRSITADRHHVAFARPQIYEKKTGWCFETCPGMQRLGTSPCGYT